jgi:hypothetical protein
MADGDLVFQSAKLRRVYDYWKAKRGTRRLPARRDIDPLDLGFVLGDIALVDVLYEPLRFRFRLDGTHQVQRFGFDMTGKLLDEYPDPEMRALIDASYRDVVASGRPTLRRRDLVADGRSFVYEVAILPMTVAGDRVEMLLSCIDFDIPRPA